MNTLTPETYDQAVLRIGRIGAFAPGDYISKCLRCSIQFNGDKRALNCLPCAVELAAARSSPAVQTVAMRETATMIDPPAVQGEPVEVIQSSDLRANLAYMLRQVEGGKSIDISHYGRIMARLSSPGRRGEEEADTSPFRHASPPIPEGLALSASDRACYEYPGEHQQAERAAFVAGALAYTSPARRVRRWPKYSKK